MKDTNPSLERLRLVFGLVLIVVCATYLWRDSLRAILQQRQSNLWEARLKVRDRVFEWVQQRRAEEQNQRRAPQEQNPGNKDGVPSIGEGEK
ncbi:MAG: hypothetical protein RLZZ399_2200 [Verrucomicrobiota bacterium]|jgi:hypothetical protein